MGQSCGTNSPLYRCFRPTRDGMRRLNQEFTAVADIRPTSLGRAHVQSRHLAHAMALVECRSDAIELEWRRRWPSKAFAAQAGAAQAGKHSVPDHVLSNRCRGTAVHPARQINIGQGPQIANPSINMFVGLGLTGCLIDHPPTALRGNAQANGRRRPRDAVFAPISTPLAWRTTDRKTLQ
jgi:hypothetical protein